MKGMPRARVISLRRFACLNALASDSITQGPAIRTRGLSPPILTFPILISLDDAILKLFASVAPQQYLLHPYKIVGRVDADSVELRLHRLYLVAVFEDPQLLQFLRLLERGLLKISEGEEKILREGV